MSRRLVCGAKRIDATLPVTAIAALELAGRRLVLSSCGPSVYLIDERSGHVYSEARAFKRHNVHGILTTGLKKVHNDHVQEIFLAWGGSSVKLLCVSVDKDGCPKTAQLSTKSAEHRAPDWILDAGFSETQEHDTVRVALITAHNVLLSVELGDVFSDHNIQMRIQELASGLNSVLYSADIAWISPTQILVAAGTVFGEIVTWSSAVVESGITADHMTGFGNSVSRGGIEVNPEGCICTTFGHISRIWGVKFLNATCDDGRLQLQLVSRGEDSTTQIWRGTLRPKSLQAGMSYGFENEGVLHHVTTREYHSGKNVWSFASFENDGSIDIYSGGADGSIITYPVMKIVYKRSDNMLAITEEDHPNVSLTEQNDRKLNRYAFVSDIHVLATSSQGEVLLGTLSSEAQQGVECDQSAVSWELLDILPVLKNHAVISSDSSSGVATLCGLSGDIFFYHHSEKSLRKIAQADQRIAGIYLVSHKPLNTSIAFVVSYMGRDDAHFFILPNLAQVDECTRISLQAPQKFVVTSAEYIHSQDCLILGGRTGGICLFNIADASGGAITSPSLNLEHVHGKDTTTSIILLPQESVGTAEQNILTTGRDGYYSVHEVIKTSTSYLVRTIHRSSPPLGSNLEGAYIDSLTNDLILFGFRSTQFTIYNETAQSLVSAVECGGAHRSWAFSHSASLEGRKTFAWTKASTFNLSSRVGLIQRSVRIGGHGREIKTMCSSPVQYNIHGKSRRVIATGAEDTTIRLFAYSPASHIHKQGCFNCILTLRKHTTGLQHLQFSPCGRYLFSSGGLEEFYVWRVRCISGLGFGAVLEAECPKSAPRTDLRITSVDILQIEGGETDNSFLISLTYSNSEVKVFMYTSSATKASGIFTLVAQGRYKTNCLTHVRFAQVLSQVYLITASTDGHIALWSIESVLAPFATFDDNNHLRKCQSADTAQESIITWQYRHRVHQSSIKALDMISPQTTSTTTSPFVLVTGGDDNSLAVTSIALTPSDSENRFATSYISKGRSDHAAAINDVSILFPADYASEKIGFQFASSGNDQQLKVFDVSLKMSDSDATQQMDATCLRNVYTPVADVASVGCFYETDKNTDMSSGFE
ncbi:hypothetical protein KEM56_006726, partial [Ascosphaera pollenicola]